MSEYISTLQNDQLPCRNRKTTGQFYVYTEMESKLSSFNNSKIKRTSWFKHVVITPAVSAVLWQHRGHRGRERIVVREPRYLD
jgi:hypothetical protein